MLIHLLKIYTNLMSKISLKTRFVGILFVNCAVTLLIVGTISFYTIRTLHENNLKDSIQSSINDVGSTMKNAYANLENITKQFAYENTVISGGSVETGLKQFVEFIDGKTTFTDQQTFDFSKMVNDMRSTVNFITSINPDIGLSLFYRNDAEAENQILYSSELISTTQLDIPALSILQSSEYISLNGIHKTAGYGSNQVISVERKMNILDMDDVYVYVETSAQWFNTLIQKNEVNSTQIFLMTGKDDNVIYSNDSKAFPIGLHLETARKGNRLLTYGDYYILTSEGDGWKVMTAMLKSEYSRKIVNWVKEFALVVMLALFITLLVSIFVWRSVYRPIKAFRCEFQLLADNAPSPKIRRTRIKEFDELLLEFYHARVSIIQLVDQIEQKEKRQKELEIEKLLIQINPHFIYNTLNSIQWMARLNEQPEIEKMATLFARVLKYNLGKKDIIVTMNDEIDAMETYIELQKLRYNSTLSTFITVEQSLKDVKIPRFILQPIVENSIFHGMNDKAETFIKITVEKDEGEYFHINVEDNGQGIEEEEIKRLLNGEPKGEEKSGFGIGLKYVNSMIQFYYGEQYHLQITSKKGIGTTVSMQIPIKMKEEKYD